MKRRSKRPRLDPELGFIPQPMVRWLGPRGLLTTAGQVMLSTIFGAYSDKREIQAALKESSETDFSDCDELWMDFLADTGDGFDPTFTTACLLRQDLELTYDGTAYATQRGRLVLLGGDLAYPAALPETYRDRFTGPFQAAFPEPGPGEARPAMIACAGNHDWYDGLTTFLRLFCQGREIGGWRTQQSRSYFTVRLPHDWWIMGIDLAFDFYIDEPQMAFFRREVAQRMRPGDKVILVTHKPSWLFSGIGDEQLHTPMSMTNLQQFEHDIIHAHGLSLPLVLAGDIHHYNRYLSAGTGQHRITSGAAAAFLYPTNHLAPEFDWPEAGGRAIYRREAVYPDIRTSRRLRWGTLLAPLKNPSFIVFVSGLYLLFALAVRFGLAADTDEGFLQALRDTDPGDVVQEVFNHPGTFMLAMGLAGVLIVFADAATWSRRFALGFLHWLFHFALLVMVIWVMAQLTLNLPERAGLYFGFVIVSFDITFDVVVFILGVAIVGGYLSSQLFATYLFLMFALFGRHANHAFSSQRIPDYRNFLRMKFDADGALTIYPIGVRKVPRRWRRVGADRPPGAPKLEPADHPIECHLIEAPIRIEPREAGVAPREVRSAEAVASSSDGRKSSGG